MIIRCKIDVTKIDKARLFKGEKGTYLDITLLENKSGVDQYGNNGMIVQDVTKAERESGQKGAILGNFKIVGANPPAAKPAASSAPKSPIESDDVPF